MAAWTGEQISSRFPLRTSISLDLYYSFYGWRQVHTVGSGHRSLDLTRSPRPGEVSGNLSLEGATRDCTSVYCGPGPRGQTESSRAVHAQRPTWKRRSLPSLEFSEGCTCSLLWGCHLRGTEKPPASSDRSQAEVSPAFALLLIKWQMLIKKVKVSIGFALALWSQETEKTDENQRCVCKLQPKLL